MNSGEERPWCERNGIMLKLDRLADELEGSQPVNVKGFILEWIEENLNTHLQPASSRRRGAISGETFQPGLVRTAEIPVIEKDADEMRRLKALIQQVVDKNFMFAHLSQEDIELIYGAVKEVRFDSGVRIIQQGDEGDYFYLLEKGSCNVYMKTEGAAEEGTDPYMEADERYVSSYGPGEYFGELALYYAAPRAASIVTTEPCVCWCIDRLTYRTIIMGNSIRRRSQYQSLMESLPLLSQLTNSEKLSIIDALETEVFPKDTTIIKQGDSGENFYFLLQGKCRVEKDGETVGELGAGDYFGERALLTDEPRAASIIALGPVALASLARTRFNRLVEVARPILTENLQKY